MVKRNHILQAYLGNVGYGFCCLTNISCSSNVIIILQDEKEKENSENDEELTVRFMYTFIMDVEAWTDTH